MLRAKKYDFEQSNVALVGTDLDHKLKLSFSNLESAWKGAGTKEGLQIWRIEDFQVVAIPREGYGSFYEGDSYIVLRTYKKSPEAKALSYDVFFWLGSETTQDEAGTAAYKTVELDEHLHGTPVQYRELQFNESTRFGSLFPRLVYLRGGCASGFTHTVPNATDDRPLRLYRVKGKLHSVQVVEVEPACGSLNRGDVFVCEHERSVWQWNGKESNVGERVRGGEFARSLAEQGGGGAKVEVFDEGGGAGAFYRSLSGDVGDIKPATADATTQAKSDTRTPPRLFQFIEDSVSYKSVDMIPSSSLDSAECYLLDTGSALGVYVRVGKGSGVKERQLALNRAERYLKEAGRGNYGLAVFAEGQEPEAYVELLG